MLVLCRVVFGWVVAVLSTNCALAAYLLIESSHSCRELLFIFLVTLYLVAVLSILPATAVVALGEYLSIRHMGYYASGGIAAGLFGWINIIGGFSAAQGANVNDLYMITLGGAFGGFIYWLAAGRHAGKAPDNA